MVDMMDAEARPVRGGSGTKREPLVAPTTGRITCFGRTLMSIQASLVVAYLFVLFIVYLSVTKEIGEVVRSIGWGILTFVRVAFPVVLMVSCPPKSLLFGTVMLIVCAPWRAAGDLVHIVTWPGYLLVYAFPLAICGRDKDKLASLSGPQWLDALCGVLLWVACFKVGKTTRIIIREQRLRRGDWMGGMMRCAVAMTSSLVLALPFFLTSALMVHFVQFLLSPWYNLPKFQKQVLLLRVVEILTMVLSSLLVAQLIYRRRQHWFANRRLEEVIKWTIDHPFHAELEQEFGSSRTGRGSTFRRLTRTFSTLAKGPNESSVKQKQTELIELRREMIAEEMGSLGLVPNTLRVSVSRERLWEDTSKFLLERPAHELLAPTIRIGFKDEFAIDMGGVTRDWFDSVAKVLMEEAGDPRRGILAKAADETLIPRPQPQTEAESSAEEQKRLRGLVALGRFVALAVFHKQPIPVAVSSIACKHMLNVPVGEKDVRRLDPEFYQGRVKSVMVDGGLEALEEALGEPLYFVSAPTPLRPTPEELKPGGANIVVTSENRHEYVRLLCEAFLCGGMRREIQCMLQGFWDLMPPALLEEKQVNPRELSIMISGVQDLDPKLWKDSAKSGDTQVHKWFWEVVTDMSQEERCMLLHFTTGSSRLPAGGFQDLSPKFVIEVAGDDCEHLPHAHTCVNQLILSQYTSKEQLKEKLLIALKQGEGFGFA